MRPKIIVLASGTKTGGGSGFEKLVEASKSGILDADIAAVVCNHPSGGVAERANRLGVTFIHLPMQTLALYRAVASTTGVRDPWFACSGWLRKIEGLDPSRTFNIHPALLSFRNRHLGGPGMYGHHVHEEAARLLESGELTEAGCSMHFVTPEYDQGPIFFESPRVSLRPRMSANDIGKAVNELEHSWQAHITNLVVHGEIAWDGKDPKSLVVPENYMFLP